MLKPALLHRDQLLDKEALCMFDLEYQYYSSWAGFTLTDIKNDNWEVHQFVSVDKDNNIIGYIVYSIDHNTLSAHSFGIISFDRGNLIFMKDVYQVIYDIFFKYNLNRLEWFCYADNPAVRGYRNFIKRVGGKECGYKTRNVMLIDHKLHDTVEFEILKEDFKPIKRGVHKDV